jgi:type IV secretory pathway VirJ component
MARELASLNALVVGIDINHFVKEIEASNEKCLYPAADFQFHLTDWFTSQKRPNSQMVHPEMGKLRGKRILCFYGTEDDDALCRQLDPGLAKVISIQGGHRFGKAYQPIIDAILQEIQ